MSESHSIELPASVCRRDGRVVPFEADKICQAIFQATEAIGQPNAFLAREMTDGVLHFLAQEHGAATPATEQVAELVVKVLRELGQPGLAQAFEHVRKTRNERSNDDVGATETVTVPLTADQSPEQFAAECRRAYSVHAVFSRDLTAAQNEGFLSLAGLDHPAELAGGVLPWPGPEEGSLLAAILEARRRFGGFIVLDNPEHACEKSGNLSRQIGSFVDQLKQGLEATGLTAIVNLNAAELPPWAQQSAQGPLFQAADVVPGPANPSLYSKRLDLLTSLLLHHDNRVRVDWHLSDRDFLDTDTGLTFALQAARDQPVSFVFDRAKAPLALAEGMDRRHPAVLQVAGLHLARLADMDGTPGNLDHLLQKLLHLAQIAMSAGVQKRRFLRQWTQRHGSQAEDLRRGFFLDRARLSVVPVGLPAVVQRFAGQGVTGKQGLVLARQILERLGQCLLQAGRALNLDGVLDSPWWTRDGLGSPSYGPFFSQPHLAGLTSADFAASAEDQLRAAGALHQLGGAGTTTLLLPMDLAGNVERLTQLLHFAWKKTAVVRVRLARIPAEFAER